MTCQDDRTKLISTFIAAPPLPLPPPLSPLFLTGTHTFRRPGHFVLACGLRTFAPAFPSLDVQHGADIVAFCGEPEEAQEGSAAMEEGIGTRAGGGGGGGGGEGGGGISVILNASCLEVTFHLGGGSCFAAAVAGRHITPTIVVTNCSEAPFFPRV